MPQNLFRPRSLHLAATLAIGSLVASALVFCQQAFDEFHWRQAYERTHVFGDDCTVGIGQWPGSFTLAWAETPTMRPQKLPYRGTVSPPQVPPGGYLLSDCTITLPQFASDDYPWISLGPVFGQSQIYVGNRLIAESPNDGMVEFPVSPEDLSSHSLHLRILSKRTEKANPGMATLIPMYVATKRSLVDNIRQNLAAFSGERPIFRMAASSILTAFFVMLWISGLRFADVQWIAAIAAVVTLQNFTVYARSFGQYTSLLFRIESVLNFAFGLSLLAFYLSVIRLKSLAPKFSASQIKIGRWFLTFGICGAAGLIVALPEQWFFDLRLLSRMPALTTIALLIAGLGWAAMRLRSQMNQSSEIDSSIRLRNLRFSYLTGLTIVVCFAEIYFEDRLALALRPYSQFVMLGLYASILLRDLARRQTEYFQEVERRREKEHEAAEARALANAAQMLAHDIRRPFNMVRTIHSQLLQSDVEASGKMLTSMLPDIIKQQAHVDGLLNDLINIGKETHLNIEKFAIDICLVEAMKSSGNSSKAASLKLSYEVDPCIVIGDKFRTQRVLENIIENAVHATIQGGKLKFVIKRVNGSNPGLAILGVQNSHSFIEESTRDRVFDFAFTRGKATGTGLGLAIAKRIVTAQGGKIWCESNHQNGTTFWLTIPFSGPCEAAKLPETLGSGRCWLGEKTDFEQQNRSEDSAGVVCLIDDDPLQLLGWRFELAGSTILEFQSPEAFLRELSKGGPNPWPDFFIVDFEFKGWGGTGASLARAIKEQRPDALVAVCSNRQLSRVDVGMFADAILEKRPQPLAQLQREIMRQRETRISL